MVKIVTSFTSVILVNLTVENISITDFLISRCVESCLTVLTKVGVLGLVVQTVSNVQSTNRVATGSMISWVTFRTQVVSVSLTVENVWITDFEVVASSVVTIFTSFANVVGMLLAVFNIRVTSLKVR